MNYYCDSCFKIAHTKEEFKTHKKENIDYFNFIDVRCPEHKLSPMNLFCLKKENITISDSSKEFDSNNKKLE